MDERIRLREICHARSGDKGDTANIGLIAYDDRDFAWLAARVTADAVRAYLGDVVRGDVVRYELPRIGALNFVLHNALDGGVTRALKVDGHGKGLSAILLDMEIPAPSDDPGEPARARETPGVSGKTVRLGGGSAYEADRMDAAAALVKRGRLDYLVFDCLSEKTIIECALRQLRGEPAYDVFLAAKLRRVLPDCHANGVRIIANAGGLDVEGAAEQAAAICRELGLGGIRIAYVRGGDVRAHVTRENLKITETGQPVSSLGNALVCAHAYGGAQPIVEALGLDADIVLTSRAGDSAQYLAPMMHAFGWADDDWTHIGRGLGVGHLMECAGQVSGGYFADPGVKDVPDLADIGFPIAEVDAEGEATITKPADTGGVVDERTCKEQLVYEISDPGEYIHTDGVVDFTETELIQAGPDRVRVTGTRGRPRTDTVKAVLGLREGFVGLGRIMYGGAGAYERARLAAEVVTRRLSSLHGIDSSRLRMDYVGVNALFPWAVDTSAVREVELRVTGSFATRTEAEKVLYEVSTLPCNGPAGASWGRPLDQGGVEEVVGFYSTLVPRGAVSYEVRLIEVP